MEGLENQKIFRIILVAKHEFSGIHKILRKLMSNGVQQMIKIEAKTLRSCLFLRCWSVLGGDETYMVVEKEKMYPKSKRIGKMRPKDRLDAILGGTTSEEADPAEALELASSWFRSGTLRTPRGRRISCLPPLMFHLLLQPHLHSLLYCVGPSPLTPALLHPPSCIFRMCFIVWYMLTQVRVFKNISFISCVYSRSSFSWHMTFGFK